MPRLFDELALARADVTYTKLLGKVAKADVLILDDLGLGALNDAQRHDLLEVVEDRYGRRSTVVTTQLQVPKWHEWLGGTTVADAVLDHLVYNAHKLDLRDNSRRKEITGTAEKKNCPRDVASVRPHRLDPGVRLRRSDHSHRPISAFLGAVAFRTAFGRF